MTSLNGAASAALAADQEQIAAFVDGMFRYASDGGYVSLRSFYHDPRRPPADIIDLQLKPSQRGLEPLIKLATNCATRAANLRDPAVFAPPICTFQKRRSASEANLAEGLVLSIECDSTPSAARELLTGLIGRPTIVLASGGTWTNPGSGEVEDKLHMHWRLSEPTREAADHQRLKRVRIIACLLSGSDASAAPMVHPLRWPGSWHRKIEPPRLAAIVESNPAAEVHLEEALDQLEEAANLRGVPLGEGQKSNGKQGGPVADGSDLTALAIAIPNEAGTDWKAWNTTGMAFYAASGGSGEGLAAFEAWSAKWPKGWDRDTTAARWEHFKTSPPEKLSIGKLIYLARKADPLFRLPSWDARVQHPHDRRDGEEHRPGTDPQPTAPAAQEGRDYKRQGRFIRVLTDTKAPDGKDVYPGIYVERKGKDEDGEDVTIWSWVCSPLEVAADTRDPSNKEWGRFLIVKDRDGTLHDWAMPMRLLAGRGDEFRSELLSLGLRLAPGGFARNNLHDYVQQWSPRTKIRCVDRVGWHGRAFILPDRTYGDTGGERVILQTTGTVPTFDIAGTLDGWQAEVATLAFGNSRLVFAICAGFAGALIHPVGEESGGFHFRGASSTGKTSALRVSASVWGRPYDSWRATDNAAEGMARGASDTLLGLDEISQADAQAVDAIAYMLGNGAGKARMKRDASSRPVITWRVLFLSTGEKGLAEKLGEVGKRAQAGQAVRVLEIPADAGAGYGLFEELHGGAGGDAFSRRLKLAVETHRGHAGRAFIEQVTGDLEAVTEAVANRRRRWIDANLSAGADGQVARAAGRFGLVAAAGEIAIALGIVPRPQGASDTLPRGASARGSYIAAARARPRSEAGSRRFGPSSRRTAPAGSNLPGSRKSIARMQTETRSTPCGRRSTGPGSGAAMARGTGSRCGPTTCCRRHGEARSVRAAMPP